jgi:hypothetical protein
MNTRSIVWNLVGWRFGIVVVAIGVIKLFWGNAPGYGDIRCNEEVPERGTVWLNKPNSSGRRFNSFQYRRRTR